ncbi:MAG: WD40 repeat domain-containing protein, partial [Acidobacteriota bacterium]
ELFTLNDEETQSRFAELLGRAADEAGVHVLLSLRDDFLIHCHDHAALSPVFKDLTPLRPPKGAALRRALVEPAERRGYRFEDEALVAEIMTEVTRERGALPLLAFAAARLWEKRDRKTKLLTREAYLEIDGVGGALAQHAEATLDGIGSVRQPIVREIFRNLATARATRAARDRQELLSVFEDEDGAGDVLGRLIDARLLTSFERPGGEGEPSSQQIEIIHESLLTGWPRLVRWQAQDADSALLRDQLRQAARLWDERGRPLDHLWAGASFREFQVWREHYPGHLTATEEAFAGAMVEHAQRRRRRRRLAVTAVMVALLGVATLTTTFWQRSELAREEAIAEARRAEASKLLAIGQNELARYPTAALAYALKSLELADTLGARLFALRALQQAPPGSHLFLGGAREAPRAHRVAFSPDGEWLAVGGYQMTEIRHWHGGAPISLSEYPTSGYITVQVGFGPQGKLLVTNHGGEVRFHSAPEGEELARRKLEEGPSALRMTGEGFFTWTNVGGERIVRWWSLDGGEPKLVGKIEAPTRVDIDPLSRWLAYSRGRKVYVRSLLDWSAPPGLVGEHSEDVAAIRFHPDGEWIAAGDASGEIRLWSLSGGPSALLRVLHATGMQAVRVRMIRIDPAGSRLALGGVLEGQPAVWLWDLMGPPEAEPILLKGAPVTLESEGVYLNGATFDPTGRWLVTANVGSVGFWPVTRDYPRILTGHAARVSDLAFTPDGQSIVSASSDGTVRLWPLSGEGGQSQVVLREFLMFPKVDVDPKGRRLLVASGATGARVFMVNLKRRNVGELSGFGSNAVLVPVVFDAEGRRAATGAFRGPAEEKVIRVWDLESGGARVLGPNEGTAGDFRGYMGLQFTSDGRLFSSGGDGLRLWNLEGGTAEVLASGSWQGMQMALTVDGRHLVHVRRLDPNPTERVLIGLDLKQGTSRTLPTHGRSVHSVAVDRMGSLVVTGSIDGVVRVGSVTGEEPHLLLGHEGWVRAVAVSPDGRWIASGGADGTIRLWPMPEGRPFHTLPYEELLDKLRSVTNLRVIEDEASPTGYRLEIGPFPGWETVPVW